MQRKYKESDFQTEFSKWARHYAVTGAYELKVSNTDSIAFGWLKPHQEACLTAASEGCMVHKLPDIDLTKKPFDCVVLRSVPSFVVVMFRCTERGQREFFLISLDAWIADSLTTKSSRRGDLPRLSEARARQIGRAYLLAPTSRKS